MTLNLTERRGAARAGGGDAADIAPFARALDGADEDERARWLALPPSRLFNAEGPTPRACFVLAALGKPSSWRRRWRRRTWNASANMARATAR